MPQVDPNAPGDSSKSLRAGGGLLSVVITPRTGEQYVAYEGSDFTGGAYDAIELVHSTDRERTWSGPQRINQAPGARAFTLSVTVGNLGTVAITYCDLRYLATGDTTTLPTAARLVTFLHGSADYPTERRISQVLAWLKALLAGGHFLGDYESGPYGPQFRPLFVETNDNAPLDSTDAFSGTFLPKSSPPGSPHRHSAGPGGDNSGCAQAVRVTRCLPVKRCAAPGRTG